MITAPALHPAPLRLRAPAAAGELAAAFAELAVQVEAGCQRDGCAPDCALAQAARKVAVSAAALAREWAAEGSR